MKETEYLKEKNELVDIVHCAFNDWDDYSEECYESHISPIEDVEDFVADAVFHAGYRKQSEGEWITVGRGITERVVCSNCKSERGSFMRPPFCNQCGAKMKGE